VTDYGQTTIHVSRMRCQPSPLCMHRADSGPVSHRARSVRSRNPSSISWWIDTGPDHVNVPLSEGCGGGSCLHPRTTCIRYAWLMHVESQGRRRTASLKSWWLRRPRPLLAVGRLQVARTACLGAFVFPNTAWNSGRGVAALCDRESGNIMAVCECMLAGFKKGRSIGWRETRRVGGST